MHKIKVSLKQNKQKKHFQLEKNKIWDTKYTKRWDAYGANCVFIIARLGLSPEKQLYCTYKVYVFKRYSHYK